MPRHVRALALSLAAAAPALGQAAAPAIYAVRANGDLIHLDPTTGQATFVASTGVPCQAATSFSSAWRGGQTDTLLVAGGPGPLADQIHAIDLAGTPSLYLNTTGRPGGYSARAMDTALGGLHVILSTDSPTTEDLLARIEWTGAYVVIGPTGRTDLEALARAQDGSLYALGTGDGGRLYRLSATGAATLIGGALGPDAYALDFAHNGQPFACGANLQTLDLNTGAGIIVGPTGYSDVRGIAVVPGCYANCDLGGPPPTFNMADFTCFLQRYAAGDPYANCDMSTIQPMLNVADFTCFIQAYAAACQ